MESLNEGTSARLPERSHIPFGRRVRASEAAVGPSRSLSDSKFLRLAGHDHGDVGVNG